MFGRIAGSYDLANRVLSARRDVAWRTHALKMLDDEPEVVLDLACGTFDLGIDALRLGKAQRVHGGDFCLPMLQAGSEKRLNKPISATVADALHLPYADASFDAAIMAYGWRNLDDPAAGIRELHRVLKPGGQLLILEFFKPSSVFPWLFYNTFGRCAMPLLGGIVSGDTAAYTYLRTSVQGFLNTTEATQCLTDNGFSVSDWKSFSLGISHAVSAKRIAATTTDDNLSSC